LDRHLTITWYAFGKPGKPSRRKRWSKSFKDVGDAKCSIAASAPTDVIPEIMSSRPPLFADPSLGRTVIRPQFQAGSFAGSLGLSTCAPSGTDWFTITILCSEGSKSIFQALRLEFLSRRIARLGIPEQDCIAPSKRRHGSSTLRQELVDDAHGSQGVRRRYRRLQFSEIDSVVYLGDGAHSELSRAFENARVNRVAIGKLPVRSSGSCLRACST